MTLTTRAFLYLYQAWEAIKHQVLMTVFGYHSVCKHRPTCSEYTLREIAKSGTITGLWRGIKRIARCW